MGKDLNGKELGVGIAQRANGRYEARYTNRFGKRKSITGANLKEVRKRYNEAVYENEKEISIEANMKLDEWYPRWMNVYKADTIRETTKMRYNHLFYKHISPVLGNYNLQNITQLRVLELIRKLSKNGYQYELQNGVRKLLSDMFNKAVINNLMKKNPVIGITLKRMNTGKEMQVLSVEDQVTFFQCCKGTFYDNFFQVAVSTGMRVGELAALTWKDIDMKGKIIHVQKTLVYEKYESDTKKTFHFELPKTRTSYRDIPINRQCEIALKKQYMQKHVVTEKAPASKKARKEFQDLLFTTKYDTPLNAQIVRDAIERIVKEINSTKDVLDEIPLFTCHCFRHTFATRCFEAGIKPKTVQQYLGHASLQMTMDLYTTVLKEHQTAEMEKLDTMFEQMEQSEDAQIETKFKTMSENQKPRILPFGDSMVVSG